MHREALNVPAREAMVRHLLQAYERYFPKNNAAISSLPVLELSFPDVSGPLRLVDVSLPVWGTKCGCGGVLSVPRECCADPDLPRWEQVDWWMAAFMMLEGWHERAWEAQHGAIHSYAFRLRGWDARVWERAWVNRIALFMRTWAAHQSGIDEATLFGPIPQAQLLLTHDVDAVEKTMAIRLKQTAFIGFNAIRMVARGQWARAVQRIGEAFSFFFRKGDGWTLDVTREMELNAGVRSQFNFYADGRSKTIWRWLFDPAYDVTQPRISEQLMALVRDGWRVGLHQSFDAWQASELMRQQRERLQSLVPVIVISCRQHWLRFSWNKTWRAQAQAGFEQDTTLMFNDRAGFRGAAALEWAPWDTYTGRASLKALPTVFMDSHFFDYQPMTGSERRRHFKHWLSEIAAVGGQAAVLWHPHTMSSDYGWRAGYLELLEEIKGQPLRWSF